MMVSVNDRDGVQQSTALWAERLIMMVNDGSIWLVTEKCMANGRLIVDGS